MLKQLRKKGIAKKVLWFVAVIVILSFGVFGTANYMDGQTGPRYAGKIFGRTVSLDQFQKSFLHTRNQSILRYGENFEKISQFLNLEAETWDRLILLEEAKKRRIKITDQEVIDKIQDFDFFKNNGKFDPAIYGKIVRYVFRCEPRDFEEGIRETLIFAKLFDKETLSANLSDEDIESAYQKQYEQAQVSYVLFLSDDYKKDAAVNPEEAQKYFNEHHDEFRFPMAINVEYVNLDYSSNAQAKEKSDVALKAQNIFQEAQASGDLKKAGEQFGATVKESGFFNMDQPDLKIGLPFEALQTAFDLELHQIAEPIETSQGYVLLKVKEKKDSYIPNFQEAAQKVNDTLADKKARELAKQKAEETLKSIKESLQNKPGAKFSNAAQALGLKTTQTPLFTRGQYLPTVGLSQEFQDAAFLVDEKNPVSDTIEVAKGFCFLHQDSYVPFDKEKFAKEKDNFSKTLIESKKNQAFTSFLAGLRTKANLQDNISALKKDEDPQAHAPGIF